MIQVMRLAWKGAKVNSESHKTAITCPHPLGGMLFMFQYMKVNHIDFNFFHFYLFIYFIILFYFFFFLFVHYDSLVFPRRERHFFGPQMYPIRECCQVG